MKRLSSNSTPFLRHKLPVSPLSLAPYMHMYTVYGLGTHVLTHTHCSTCLFPQVFLATLWIKIAGDPHIPL